MRVDTTSKAFLEHVPHLPGVYRFYRNSSVLYVGKAINLHKRVASYFKTVTEPRIKLMVKQINGLEFTVTANEVDALVLESTLIKQLKPRYNIIFRDDKSYPFIILSKHQYPRIDIYRGKHNSNYEYFGPYTSGRSIRHTIQVIQNLFKLRTCSDNAFNNRSRPCMLYQINQCTAPCVSYVTDSAYQQQVSEAKHFLSGESHDVLRSLTDLMHQAANNQEFEKAILIRDEIEVLSNFKQQHVNTTDQKLNADLVLFSRLGHTMVIYVVSIRSGLYSLDKHMIVECYQYSDLEVAMMFFNQRYLYDRSINCLYTNADIDDNFVKVFNAAFNIKLCSLEQLNSHMSNIYRMASDNLNKILVTEYLQFKDCHIECIDISHHHGDCTVASCVVSIDNVFTPELYRKYNLQDTNGNDVLAMQQVISLRLKDGNLPHIFLLDGGKAQLRVVQRELHKQNIFNIKLIAITKGTRRNPELDSILLDNGYKFSLGDFPAVFKLLQRLRDEAHMFAIKAHRKLTLNKMLRGQL